MHLACGHRRQWTPGQFAECGLASTAVPCLRRNAEERTETFRLHTREPTVNELRIAGEGKHCTLPPPTPLTDETLSTPTAVTTKAG